MRGLGFVQSFSVFLALRLFLLVPLVVGFPDPHALVFPALGKAISTSRLEGLLDKELLNRHD
jgi:hypothetical protein